MRRREFIALIGGAAAAWPLTVRAQDRQLRRIGLLSPLSKTDAEASLWEAAYWKQLEALGWIEGRNLHAVSRWADGDITRLPAEADEVLHFNPEVLFTETTPATAALQARTRTIPIVFVAVSDPIGSGFVASLAKPGANITGFMFTETGVIGKWLVLLRDVAPLTSCVGLVFNPKTAPYGRYYWEKFQSAASALSIEPIEAPINSAAEIEPLMAKLAQRAGAGLIIMPDTSITLYKEIIVSLAERYRVPSIYSTRRSVIAGGLMSYGADLAETYRGAATYVDRILRGQKPSELPVQLPTKFELVINLKTAKALSLDVPLHLQQLADEVIE